MKVESGVSCSAIALEFELSRSRIHQIINRHKRHSADILQLAKLAANKSITVEVKNAIPNSVSLNLSSKIDATTEVPKIKDK